jgi:putative transposase
VPLSAVLDDTRRQRMKRSKFSEEQVAYALRQAEAGMSVADVCRQLGISEATFYVWKKRLSCSPLG